MPRITRLVPVSAKTLAAEGKVPLKLYSEFPRPGLPTKAAVRTELRKWMATKPRPTGIPAMEEFKIKAIQFTERDLTKLRTIQESKVATAEVVQQKLDPQSLLGLTYSALFMHEYGKIKKEFEEKSKMARTPLQRAALKKEWMALVGAAKAILAKAGLPRITEAQLNELYNRLKKDRKNEQAINKIANTAVTIHEYAGRKAIAPVGAIVVDWGILAGDETEVESTTDLCEEPIEGSWSVTKSFSFSLKVRIKVWCPKWNDPFRTCWKTFTIAGVSFTFTLDIGYRIDCHGASAWGSATARACGTILGITICASCTASVNGVLGWAQSGTSGQCVYGAGVQGQIVCTLAGVPVFYATYPLGLIVTAPCPS